MFGFKKASSENNKQMTVSQSMAAIIRAGQDAANKAADGWPTYTRKDSNNRSHSELIRK